MTRRGPAAADALVEYVAAAAAALPERARASWLVPRATAPSVVEERLQLWRYRATGGQQAEFEKLCRARGIGDPRSWVSDVATAPGARLPGWAGELRAFLRMAAAGPAEKDRQLIADLTATGVLFVAGIVPVPVPEGAGADALAPAVALLRRALRANRGPSRALVDDLCRHFAGLLLTTLASLILGEGRCDGPDAVGAWTGLLHEYPAAGRCLGSLLEGYLGYATELCRRLDRDAEPLGSLARLPAGARARAVGCRPGAGDLHNGLRSVTIVDLSGGPVVVYKPKDLRHVEALARIADASASGLSLPRRMVRPGYGWEEFVEAAGPATADERRSAARDLGAWAFLFQLLGASDILAENVRIRSARVVPIDVETMFRFFFVDPSGAPWLPAAATGLFSLPVLRDAASRVPDVGLMTGPGRVLLDHSEDVVAGYVDAATRAGSREAAIAAEIKRAADAPVRAILRSTWVYDELRVASLRAEALRDGVARDLVLERLWVGQLRARTPLALVSAEVAAIRRLDVPLFTCSPGGTELRAAEPGQPGEYGRPVAALFEPPFAGALARAAALRRADAAELDALRAAMFCAAHNDRSGENSGLTPAGRAADPSRGVALRPAPAVPVSRSRDGANWADRAVSAAVQSVAWLRSGGPDGAPLAACLTYVARNDAVVLMPSRPFDLFSGIAGMTIALTSLARRSGDSSLREAASAAAAEAGAAAQLLADDLCQRAESGRPLRVAGAYEGVAALAVLAASTGVGVPALRRCGEVIAGQDLDDAARRPGAIESLGGLAAAFGFAAAARIEGTSAAHDRAVGALRLAADRASGSARFSSSLGMLIPSERALAAWALGMPNAAALGGMTVAGSGSRLAAVALDPAGLQPTSPSALRELDTLRVLAELEVSLVGSRRSGGFAAAAEAAGDVLLERHDATRRWFGDSLAPDRFRYSAVWGTIAVAYLLMGLAEPTRFSSIRLLEPVPSEG